MSTVMDNVAGKGRTIGTNVWIWLLLLSLRTAVRKQWRKRHPSSPAAAATAAPR